jgi:hypothetical protein
MRAPWPGLGRVQAGRGSDFGDVDDRIALTDEMQRFVPMKRALCSLLGVLVTGCAGGDSGTGGTPAPSPPALSGAPDSGAFVFSDDAGVEAGPLLSACDPNNGGSCPQGFSCYAQHTSTSWWVDLYGTCTFACDSQSFPLCDSLGGVCGCPVLQGATAGNCALDGGTAMLCVPGLKPGSVPGAGEGEGGCGTPGCGGGAGVEGGASPQDAALE